MEIVQKIMAVVNNQKKHDKNSIAYMCSDLQGYPCYEDSYSRKELLMHFEKLIREPKNMERVLKYNTFKDLFLEFKKNLREFTFNTGVKFGVNKYYDKNFRAVNAVGGGLVMVIPFYCHDVPDNYRFKCACDNSNLYKDSKDIIVREMYYTKMSSRYAYFEKIK